MDIAIWIRISPQSKDIFFLENTQFEFNWQNIWTLPIISEFPPGSKDANENSFRPFSIGLQRFFKLPLKIHNLSLCQGWGAGAGRSRVFLAPWSRSRLKKTRSRSRSRLKKNQEPEPLKISRLLSSAGR